MKRLVLVSFILGCFSLSIPVAAAEKTEDEVTKEPSWTEILTIIGYVDARVGFRQVTPEADGCNAERIGDVYVYGTGLGVVALINEYLSGYAFLLYEEDFGNDYQDLSLEEGSIRFDWKGLFATVGRMYLPVGLFETYAVADPMPLNLAECNQATIGLGYEHDYFIVSAWGFAGNFENVDEKGEADDNTMDGFAGAVKVLPLAFQEHIILELGGYLLSDATETSMEFGGNLNRIDPDGVTDNGDEFTRYEKDVPLYGGFLSAEIPITEMFGLGVVGEYTTTGKFDKEEYLDNSGEATTISAANAELAILLLDRTVQFGPKFETISGVDWLGTQENDEEYEVTGYTQFGGFIGFDPWKQLHLGLEVIAGADNEENRQLETFFQTALEF